MTGFALQMHIYLPEMSPPTVFAQLTLHFYILRFIHSQLWKYSFISGLGLISALGESEESRS